MENVSVPVGGSSRLTDRISLGVLAEILPRDLIEEILDETGGREQRSRRLPAHVMVRFCLAMCLFFDEDYEEVMRLLVGSLKDMESWRDEWAVPSTSAITQAPGLRQSHVIMTGCCGDTPGLAFSRPGW